MSKQYFSFKSQIQKYSNNSWNNQKQFLNYPSLKKHTLKRIPFFSVLYYIIITLENKINWTV